MLTHKAAGPRQDGMYLVVYPTPGCDVPTVACECRTHAAAMCEADRLNVGQVNREAAIEMERHLAEFRRIV